jgi:two-component system response regulator AtoC
MPDTMLVLEDEELLGAELTRYFRRKGWEVQLARSLAEARDLLVERDFEPLVVLADMSLPDGNALDLLEKLRQHTSFGEWVILTAYGTVPDSVRALRLGAFDFLEKPCEMDRLELVVTGAARSARAHRRLSDERAFQSRRNTVESFVGRSRTAAEVRAMLHKLAAVPLSALTISGETGVGKGLAVRILHHAGRRADGPLVELNCAALPRDLLESELFGHEAGAFTGAKGRRRGLLEQAAGGTLFLDEIGEMEIALQAKLLRAIEEHRFRRVGGEREIQVDVQIFAASNRDLQEQVREGTFRSDLYHRLGAFRLHLPTLRERREDLEDLVPLFIAEYNLLAGKAVKHVPEGVWQRLRQHDWPGNVRELRNVVERCVLFAEDEVFPEQWLQLGGPAAANEPRVEGDQICIPLDGSMTLDEMERLIIQTALERHDQNVTAAARVLRTTRETLRYRVQKYGLKPAG